MGNYTKLQGKVVFENRKDFNKFEDLWDESNYPDVFKMFIKEENGKYIYLYINPLVNSYKLIGYPDYFDNFFSLFKDNINLICYVSIKGFEEDSGIVDFYMESKDSGRLFLGSTYSEESAETIRKWHKSFIDEMPEE